MKHIKTLLMGTILTSVVLSGTAVASQGDTIANSIMWKKDQQYDTSSEMASTYVGNSCNDSEDCSYKVYYQESVQLPEKAASGWTINFYNSDTDAFDKYCGYLNINYDGVNYSAGDYDDFNDGIGDYCYLDTPTVDNWNGGFTVSVKGVHTSYDAPVTP